MRIDAIRAAIPAAAVALALAGPAFGQGAGTAGQPQGQQAQPQPMQQQPGAAMAPLTQEKLRQQLTQAGFQNVKILDAAYLVQARTGEGQMVLMMINPPPGFAAGTAGGAIGPIEEQEAEPGPAEQPE